MNLENFKAFKNEPLFEISKIADLHNYYEPIGLTYGNRKHFGFPELLVLVALGGS